MCTLCTSTRHLVHACFIVSGVPKDMKMPAAHVEELQKLHRLYQRGEFDIDTVQTKHQLIVEYQRKRAVGGNLGTVYQSGALTYDEMEPSVAELDYPDENPLLTPLVAGRQGDTSGCSSVYHDINADGAAAAGSFGAFVRGGCLPRWYAVGHAIPGVHRGRSRLCYGQRQRLTCTPLLGMALLLTSRVSPPRILLPAVRPTRTLDLYVLRRKSTLLWTCDVVQDQGGGSVKSAAPVRVERRRPQRTRYVKIPTMSGASSMPVEGLGPRTRGSVQVTAQPWRVATLVRLEFHTLSTMELVLTHCRQAIVTL